MGLFFAKTNQEQQRQSIAFYGTLACHVQIGAKKRALRKGNNVRAANIS
jgi:hypothetical protein